MRAKKDEKIVFTYISKDLISDVKNKLNEFNLTYSGRIGIASLFYSKLLKEAGEANIHSLPDRGNHPSVKYILHRKTATWQDIPPEDTWRTPHQTGKEEKHHG